MGKTLGISEMSRADVIKIARDLNSENNKLKSTMARKLDVLERRVVRKNENIRKLKNEVFFLNKKLYAQKLRFQREKTAAKKKTYEKAVNNIIDKKQELLDVTKYHMYIVELAEVFQEEAATIVVLMWASRYEIFSNKEFSLNFPTGSISYLKYIKKLLNKGYVNKFDRQGRYYMSPSGVDVVERINKYINKRVNG